jgi:hypothetical protein
MRRRLAIAVAAITAVAMMPAGSALAAPAVDEYTLRLPDASGDKNLGPSSPQAEPRELPAAVRDELEGSPDGPALAQIATADELAAPVQARGSGAGEPAIDEDSTEGRGFLSAALSTLGDPIGIAILLALAGIVAAVVLLRSRASGGGTGGPSRE